MSVPYRYSKVNETVKTVFPTLGGGGDTRPLMGLAYTKIRWRSTDLGSVFYSPLAYFQKLHRLHGYVELLWSGNC